MRTKLQKDEMIAYFLGVVGLVLLITLLVLGAPAFLLGSCQVWGQDQEVKPAVKRVVILGFYIDGIKESDGTVWAKEQLKEWDSINKGMSMHTVYTFKQDSPVTKRFGVKEFPCSIVCLMDPKENGLVEEVERFSGRKPGSSDRLLASANKARAANNELVLSHNRKQEAKLDFRPLVKPVTMNENPAPAIDPVSVVCFTATWCPNCPNQKAVLERLSKEDKVIIQYVDIDKEKKIAEVWEVGGTVPTTFVVKRVKQPNGSYSLVTSTKVQGISSVEKMRAYVSQAKEGR